MYTLLAHYLSPLLLILFLMDNTKWIDYPFFQQQQQQFKDLKNITVTHLCLILNQINFLSLFLQKLVSFKIILFWSLSNWSTLIWNRDENQTVLQLSHYLYAGIQKCKKWHFCLHTMAHCIYAFNSSILWVPFLLFCHLFFS